MLEKPALPDEKISACLQADYGLTVFQVSFLPLGADRDTAVYRVVAEDGKPYFLKLRSSGFDETSVALPKFLSDQGIKQIIAPLVTKTGQLWASLDVFNVILYPFVEGLDGYEVDLTDRHWIDLGITLKRIHTIEVPEALRSPIRRETYSPTARESIRTFLDGLEERTYFDLIAIKLAAFLKAKREVILDLVERAERLAQVLQACPHEFILCHADIHAGNIFIAADGCLYVVDWDDLIMAPKERDLMFIGGSQFGAKRTPQEEETQFYQGYGPTQIDPDALAYYRYERVIEDLAIECGQIFLTDEGSEDRERALQYFTSNFLPDNTIEIAYRSDQTLKD